MKTIFDDELGTINVIPQDIGRVIFNLLNNAFYACPRKKKSNALWTIIYEPDVSISTGNSGSKY